MDINRAIFDWINASTAPNDHVVAVASFLAAWPVWIAAALVPIVWIWGTGSWRRAALLAGIAADLGLVMALAMGLFWYEERPFMVGVGQTLIAHVPDNSFPSDHVTVMLSIAFGFWLGGKRLISVALVVISFAVAWSRILSWRSLPGRHGRFPNRGSRCRDCSVCLPLVFGRNCSAHFGAGVF